MCCGQTDLYPLNCREHGNGGGNNAIPKKQAGPYNPDHAKHQPRSRTGGYALGKGHNGQNAAFAIMVGPHNEQNIFDGHDQDQGPEDQAGNTHDLPRFHLMVVGNNLHRGPKSVKRACANITIHNAQYAQKGRKAHGSHGMLRLIRVELGNSPWFWCSGGLVRLARSRGGTCGRCTVGVGHGISGSASGAEEEKRNSRMPCIRWGECQRQGIPATIIENGPFRLVLGGGQIWRCRPAQGSRPVQ